MFARQPKNNMNNDKIIPSRFGIGRRYAPVARFGGIPEPVRLGERANTNNTGYGPVFGSARQFAAYVKSSQRVVGIGGTRT